MDIVEGSTIRLKEQPTGYLAKHYALTVGKEYKCLGFMGSCIITNTDIEGETASYYRGNVQFIK